MSSLPVPSSDSPTRSIGDSQQFHPVGGSPSTHPLSNTCRQPYIFSPQLSPRIFRRRISHNISSLVNKFESTSTNVPPSGVLTKVPPHQSPGVPLPRDSTDHGDGIQVLKRRTSVTCRTGSTMDASQKEAGLDNLVYSSDDQVVLETTTFMRRWDGHQRMGKSCELRLETTSDAGGGTLKDCKRYPPRSILNRMSRSSVSPSDCVAWTRGRLNSVVKEKVRLFDGAMSTANNTNTKPSLASLTIVKTPPRSFLNNSHQSSVVSTYNSNITLTPTRSMSIITPTRDSIFRTPREQSANCTPLSSDPFLSHEATPNSRRRSSPTKSNRPLERPYMLPMTPKQATTAMELLTLKGSPVRYKLIPTVKELPSTSKGSYSLRGSWRRKVDDAFNLDSGCRQSLHLTYGKSAIGAHHDESSALCNQRKLFARIGLRSDIFKEPSEESERLQAQKEKPSKVASLKRFFDRASAQKTSDVQKGRDDLESSMYKFGRMKTWGKTSILPRAAPVVTPIPIQTTQVNEPWANSKAYKELPLIPTYLATTPQRSTQSALNQHKTPGTTGKIIGDKLKIFEVQEQKIAGKGSLKERNSLAQSTNKRSQRLKRFSRGTLHRQGDGENDTTEGSTLRSDESIVQEFQTTESRMRKGKRKVLFEKWRTIERSMHNTSRKKGNTMMDLSDSRSQAGQHREMVIKEADCGLKQPKPLRIVEMKRMILLCSDKVGSGAERDKVAQLRRLWHGYLRGSPTLENRSIRL